MPGAVRTTLVIKICSQSLATMAAILVSAGMAHAATATWAPNSDRLFSNSANWTGLGLGQTPGSSDDVVVDGSVFHGDRLMTIDVNVDVASFTIQNGFTNTINPPAGQTIRVRGDMAINLAAGGLTFNATTSSIQIDGNWSQSNGTFTSASGDGSLTINGTLSLSGGTFSATNLSALKVVGDVSLTGGTFRQTNATMQIGGSFTHAAANTLTNNAGATILLNAASGTKTHTFGGANLEKVIINDSLVGYWNLDEAASPFADSSGYANNGTLTGTYTAASTRPPVAFSDAAAVALNGSTNYLTVGTTNLPAANVAQTISAWVNFAGAATTQSIVAMTASGSAIKLGLGGGNLRVLRSDGTALVQVAAPSSGAWHHVAFVYDPTLSGGSKDKVYVDGVATTGTSSSHDGATPTAAFLGASSAGTELLTGSLDEVRIYNRALGSREMKDMAFGRMPGTGVVTHNFSDAFLNGSNSAPLVLLSGILTGSSTLSVHGSWLNYGAQFLGTGTVTLTSGQGTAVLLSGGQSFANLTSSGGTYTMADRLWVPGTLNVSSGNFNASSYTIRAGYLTTNSATGFQPATGTVVLEGSSDQNIKSKNFWSLRIEDPTENGLVGYWKFDAGQGTSARDSSDNGNTGTLSASGATWTAASPTITFENPNAMSFDGAVGYVSVGTTGLPAANAAQTVSAWIKFSSSASTQTVLAMTGASSAVKLGLGGGSVQVLKNSGTLVSAPAPSAGSWHHVAYTWDGATNTLSIDGSVTTSATAHDGAAVTGAFIGATNAGADFFSGQIDDVRVYSAALTSAQVKELVAGRYAGTGGLSTVTQTSTQLTIALGAVGMFIDSGNYYSGTQNVTVSATTSPVIINSGSFHIGSGVFNPDGGLTVNPMATLLMDTSGGQLQPGVDSTVAINGTLVASNTGAIIQRDGSGQRYRIRVGTTSTATPTLNITGLAVRDMYAEGMFINYDPGARTTITRFDNVAFLRAATGAGTQFLKIYGTSLYLTSNGCSFGISQAASALPASAVTLTGNGTADGETRAIFGGATCANSKTDGTTGLCVTTWKTDDDPDGDGVGNTPLTNGAVVQWLRGAGTDTAGSIEGLPTAAFDWNTFTYYSTYVAFHNASGTADRIYVRDQTGAPKYSWDAPSGETIVGTPRWNTTSGSHYLYVALASGKVYRLIDNGSSLVADSSGGWAGANNPFNCGCTIVSPLALDANNLYWGGTTSGPTTQKVWTLGQVSRAQPVGSPFVITPVITSAAPAIWTSGATSYLFIGLTGNIVKLNVTTQVLDSTNTSPGSASIRGRLLPTTSSNRVFAGDDGGTMWAFDANNFAGMNKLWSYVVASDSIQSSPYYDMASTTVHFGTEGGKVIALNSSGTALIGYPYVPGSTSDSIRTPMLYQSGILIVGTTTGKLFFLDRNNGTTGPTLIKFYAFGPTEAVSGVGYDPNARRYMVSTADSSTNDGRLYFVDLIADPTPGTP